MHRGVTMQTPFSHALAALAAPMLLAGCAGQAEINSPSLARRDVERGIFEVVPAPPPAVEAQVPDSGSVGLEAVNAIVARADKGIASFDAALDPTRQTVRAAGGSGIASDAWSEAQTAISALNAARGELAVALADLDRQYVLATELKADGQAVPVADIAGVRTRLADALHRQDEALADLRGMLEEP